MRFAVLGPVEVCRGAEAIPVGGGRPRALLALLALRAGRVVPVERLVDDLWGDDVPDSAVKMVQIAVSSLRKVLGPGVVVTRPPGYLLDLDGGSLDLHEFEELHRRGRLQLPRDPAAAVETLMAALALWRGPALAEFSEPFAAVEAARLEEARLDCLEDRIDACLACGRHRELIGDLEVEAAARPLRPRIHGQLMLALYRSQRHAEALDAYRRHRSALDELGIEPSAPLRDLERRIIRQDPELDLAPAALAEEPEPAAPLLEREGALAELGRAFAAARLGSGQIVCVQGEPGIGKTTLVTRFLERLPPSTRSFLGTCDDLSTPPPLGPLRELAPLADAVAAGATPYDVHTLLVAELETPPRPTVLVLEDVHWADEATLDVITVLGRRIGALPSLLILTYRAGEVGPGHPLHAALGGVRPETATVITLEPLSEAAVAALVGEGAAAVYAATRGNPFYVTELSTAAPGTDLPATVANAVRGRAARLDDDARRLVDLVSVVPGRVRVAVLDTVMPNWPDAAEEPERRQLLRVDEASVRFRHELARHAIGSSLTMTTRRRLHHEILDALIDAVADPAEIVHHAELAGAAEVVRSYRPVAARRAAKAGANREAFVHYQKATTADQGRTANERACLLEELTSTAYAIGRLDVAFPSLYEATTIWKALGEREGVGRCTRIMSRLHWTVGDGAAAREQAAASVAILEPLGESVELARAFSGMSQLAMLAEDADAAFSWGEQALELATRLGAESVRAHALVNIGTMKFELSPHSGGPLLAAYQIADAAGDFHEGSRALLTHGFCLYGWALTDQAEPALERARAYAEEYEIDVLGAYIAASLASLRLRMGEWDEAERLIAEISHPPGMVSHLVADRALAELAVRRGDPDAAERLARVTALADRSGELQRIVPVLEIAAEHALLSGDPAPVGRFERVLGQIRRVGGRPGWAAARTIASAALSGIEADVECPPYPPWAEMARRDWRAAADAFGRARWPYDRALMLAQLDDPEALREAIAIAEQLGAAPLARYAAARLS
jgi:DNA-binding SARP family transcriptional activator